MASKDLHVITGYIGRTDELRYTPTGSAVINFTVAVSWGKDDKEQTTWYRFSAWGQRAEYVHQFVGKGTFVQVIASQLTVRPYEGKSGAGFSIEARADDVTVLQRSGEPVNQSAGDESTEDIPF